MSDKPISPLRQHMIEDMTVRNFVEKTRNDYIRHVRTFTAFLGRAPDTATPEDQPGGDRTAAGSGPRAEVQGCAERRLWRRTAGLRSRGAEGVGHRFRAHAAAHRAGQGAQGAQGSLCNAFPAAIGVAARLVSYRPARGLAVPGP